MKFTQRPLWALELLIAVLGLIGIGALAKHYVDRPRIEAARAGHSVRAPSVPAHGEQAWLQHCQDAAKAWRADVAQKVTDPDFLEVQARSVEGHCAEWQRTRIETLLQQGQFDAAGQAWGALDRWHRQMLGADSTWPRLQQVSDLAHAQAAMTRGWIAKYPGWVELLAGQVQAWPKPVVPAASDAWPDPERLPNATADLELLTQAQSAWLHALRLPPAEREAFVRKQPGGERFSVEGGKLHARSSYAKPGAPDPMMEWAL